MEIILMIVAVAMIMIVSIKIKIKKRKRKNEIIQKKEPQESREKLLLQIKDIGKYQLEAYEGESKKEMGKLKNEKNELVEKIMSETFYEMYDETKKDIEELKERQKIFREHHIKNIKMWEGIENEMTEYVEYMRKFYDSNTFYPHEFIHDTNRVQRKLEDLREEKRKNPLGDYIPYKNLIDECKKSVEDFQKIRDEIVMILEKNETKKEENSEIKHQLFMALSQGNYEKAEGYLKELKKRA